MSARFVVIPALPLKSERFDRYGRGSAVGIGYDLYDTQNKLRLVLSFSTRAEAEVECACRNRARDENSDGVCGRT
ncbi:hypothetical protein N5D48_00265 [Pseudomonas sp. GD03858]|uniref:hypothetical protein n=1 Tax=unclassified Pseudomonas TaxID=196821 RepID=UPI002446D5CB|nr:MULTISPECIES: hypothetical protein [unclassified Pseudomonas]MDH0645205.1 hypothetical protein [Pseudomonas sp. GD03867]MDH0660827.1 hypothetical protein [Pseudomonas sp. GD03858]